MPVGAWIITCLLICQLIPGLRQIVGVLIVFIGTVPMSYVQTVVQAPLRVVGIDLNAHPWGMVAICIVLWLTLLTVIGRPLLSQNANTDDARLNIFILIAGYPFCLATALYQTFR